MYSNIKGKLLFHIKGKLLFHNFSLNINTKQISHDFKWSTW